MVTDTLVEIYIDNIMNTNKGTEITVSFLFTEHSDLGSQIV